MRRDRYRGDTPAKKLSRLQFWLHARKLLGDKRFFAGPHLVLLSREAGDVSVLLGLGVSLDRIVGVDWKAPEAALARVKFPGLQVHCDEIESFAQRTQTKFACCFLDFCATSSVTYFNKVVTVSRRCVQDDGLVGAAFMVGRENSMRVAALKYRREVEKQIAQMEHSRRQDAEALCSYFSRAFLIQHEIEKRSGKDLLLESRFYYSSKVDEYGGHPWCGSLFWKKPKASRKVNEPECFYFESSESHLRDQALALTRKKWPAGLLLNLPETVIAGWKRRMT